MAADSGTTDGPGGSTGWKYYNGLGAQPLGVAFLNGLGRLEGRWYLTDHLGSVTAVEDSAGERTLSLSLDPWGNLEVAKGSEGVGYAYTGKMLDGLLGGSDHGARMLDNRMGMWWGRDRAGQWWNPWARTVNPNGMIDPDGNKDLRIAIYYNAEWSEEAQKSIPFDSKAAANEMQSVLSQNLTKDVVSVKVFKAGDEKKMMDFVNKGQEGVIVSHSDVNLPYISDQPEFDESHHIQIQSLEEKAKIPVGVSACGAQVTIGRGDYKKLVIVQGTTTRDSEVFVRATQHIESVSDTKNGGN